MPCAEGRPASGDEENTDMSVCSLGTEGEVVVVNRRRDDDGDSEDKDVDVDVDVHDDGDGDGDESVLREKCEVVEVEVGAEMREVGEEEEVKDADGDANGGNDDVSAQRARGCLKRRSASVKCNDRAAIVIGMVKEFSDLRGADHMVP